MLYVAKHSGFCKIGNNFMLGAVTPCGVMCQGCSYKPEASLEKKRGGCISIIIAFSLDLLRCLGCTYISMVLNVQQIIETQQQQLF